MRRLSQTLLIVTLSADSAVLGGEVAVGLEAHRLALADVPTQPVFLGGPWLPLDPAVPIASSLQGVGVRIYGSVGPSQQRDRLAFHFQRFGDSDTSSVPLVAVWFGRKVQVGSFDVAARVRLTALDLLWIHDVVGPDRAFALRTRVGYAYLRARQSRDEATFTPLVADGSYAIARRTSTLSGHGLRGGLETERRIAGPLRFEAEGALGLLVAGEEERSETVSDSILGPRRSTAVLDRGRRGVVAWELATRLRVDWRRLSVSAGYRFARWDGAGRFIDSDALGLDGPFAGVACRLGR